MPEVDSMLNQLRPGQNMTQMLTHTLHLQALASNLLGRAKDLAANEDLGYEVCFQLNLMLAHVHAKQARHLLATLQADGTLASGEAISLLNTANEIIGNMTSDDEDPAVEEKVMAANQLSAQVCKPYQDAVCCIDMQQMHIDMQQMHLIFLYNARHRCLGTMFMTEYVVTAENFSRAWGDVRRAY